MTLLANEIESGLTAANVHAHVREDTPETLLIEIDPGSSEEDRERAIAIFFARLHHIELGR